MDRARMSTVAYEFAGTDEIAVVPKRIAGKNGHNSRKKQEAVKNKTETPTHFHQ
jgi:hypothetical protein